MKIGNLVVALIVIVLAALLLADGILSNIDPANELFNLNAVKGIVGFVLLVLAASYFKAAKE